jgi:hypothetical protein
MGWTALMYILCDPAWTRFRLGSMEARSDRQPTGNAAHGLMEESGMAGFETADEVVHAQLELIGIAGR